MSGPATGRRKRATMLRAALPCLALIAFDDVAGASPNADPRSVAPGAATASSRRRICRAQDQRQQPATTHRLRRSRRRRQRSATRTRRRRRGSARFPHTAFPPPAAHRTPASTRSIASARSRNSIRARPSRSRRRAPAAAPARGRNPNCRCGCRSRRPKSANKTPLPPAMAGTVVGQPPRKRLKVDDDPFGAVGDYAGSFLIKSAVELRGGYDTNPGRLHRCRGRRRSGWSRRNFSRSPTGSATRWSPICAARSPAMATAFRRSSMARSRRRRPTSTGRISSATSTAASTSPKTPISPREVRLLRGDRQSRQPERRRPASPDIRSMRRSAAPSASTRNSTGWSVAAGATVDRTVYQNSTLTDGTTATNDDRTFNQYGGVGRVSYELTPGVKPFVEVEGDTRVHDLPLDNSGYARNSTGGYAKGGTSFEFSRLSDRRNLGRLGRAQLCRSPPRPAGWPAHRGLAGVDGDAADHGEILSDHLDRRDHRARRLRRADASLHRRSRSRFPPLAHGDREVHLRHATTTRATDGSTRFTRSRATSIYKLTRNLWIKGTLRRDILNSNIVGSSSASTVVMLGVRLQN